MTRYSGRSFAGFLSRVDRALEAILRGTSIVCLAALAVLVSALVLVRFFPIIPLDWSDEIVELAFAWMVFLGTAALWRSHEHIAIDFIPQALAGTRAGRALEVFLALLALVFLAVFTWHGWLLTVQARDTSPMLLLPRPLWYATLPLSGLVMIGYTVSRALRAVRSVPPAAQTGEAR
jgi:TRAP-type C4-dicarboxylate transport system permease small subunit